MKLLAATTTQVVTIFNVSLFEVFGEVVDEARYVLRVLCCQFSI
jgi:hypothetical protein